MRSHNFYSLGGASGASPGVEYFSPAGVAPDALSQRTASTRPNPSAKENFNNTHAKGASGEDPPACKCVDLPYTDRDPCRVIGGGN